MTGPAWAQGHDVTLLQSVVDEFAAHEAEHVWGPFTSLTKPLVAEWLTSGRLLLDRRPLVARERVSRAVTVKDFTHTPVARLPIGGLHVKRVAFTDDESGALVQMLSRAPVLFEGWAAHPAHQDVAARAGLHRVGTKVRSSSELVALWGRGCYVKPRDSSELLGMAPLALEFDVDAAVAELSVVDEWVDHYSSYNLRHTWSAVALRSFGGTVEMIEKPTEMTRPWQRAHPEQMRLHVLDTPLRERLPAVQSIVDAIPGEKQRVRLMRLSASGGELQRHTDIGDPEAGIADGRVARVHVPLITSPGVSFLTWPLDGGEPDVVQMRTGDAWYLDTRKPHSARNDGASERVHLVVDVHSSPALRALLP